MFDSDLLTGAVGPSPAGEPPADLDDAAFVDADIRLHAAVVAAAHNSVLDDLFATLLPVLRQGLIDGVALLPLRETDANHGDAAHAALVEAIRAGAAEEAARIAYAEIIEGILRLASAS